MSNTPSTTSSANIYGVCMATTVNGGSIDIAPGVLATGNDVLAQSLVRRQMTPQGSDPSAPNDGIDVRQLVSAGMTQAQINKIPGQIQAQLLRDQRVSAVSVTAAFNQATNTLTLIELIQPVLTGPFSLTLAVTSVTVTLLQSQQ
jgi:phage baseplate assembly protein W